MIEKRMIEIRLCPDEASGVIGRIIAHCPEPEGFPRRDSYVLPIKHVVQPIRLKDGVDRHEPYLVTAVLKIGVQIVRGEERFYLIASQPF